jgi:hypothetical protein
MAGGPEKNPSILRCPIRQRRFEFFAWWTRSQRIRTDGEVPFEVALAELSKAPAYQEIAAQAAHLHLLGMNPNRIAVRLVVDRTTVTRALRWIRSH